ncbi:hypothetical+protein [Methylocapsa aurea]
MTPSSRVGASGNPGAVQNGTSEAVGLALAKSDHRPLTRDISLSLRTGT